MALHDARMMRALAHPTRLALLEALEIHATLTATEASGVVGETPTNCAFHLRALGKFGLVEEVPTGPGRRRPWRLADQPVAFSDVQPEEQSALAARALSDVIVQRWLDRIRRVQAERHREPAQWQEIFGGSRAVMFLTPDEAAQVIAEIRSILDRYEDRRPEEDRRPPDSRAVELLLFAQPNS